MNRIILIGNGFDLAHGLETSYAHFIDDYWRQKIVNIEKNSSMKDADVKFIRNYSSTQIRRPLALLSFLKGRNIQPEFQNTFLESITTHCNLENWVDIENEYYEALKNCMEASNEKYVEDKNEFIDKLNEEFKGIKTALIAYLNDEFGRKETSEFPYENIVQKIYSKINKSDLTEDMKRRSFNSLPTSILFLNFNYTPTEQYYSKIGQEEYVGIKMPQTVETIYIHGKLDNPSDIIFGYGDEIDDKYKLIENLNNNRYLANIKSFKYFDTNNYKKLLNFINSDSYQIFIFGHSCGNSDRTLLNTLFEHDNCASIKVFYHLKDDGTDNYSDVVQNISRHFKPENKSMMRDKVVNKSLCEPLIS
ncbi:hypothetical protein AGMMS4957_02730 [Bacteroidia bacterium]|nr:hypothetical protein AGMMS4957_02730 [Bacteroidia bacterium]